MEGKSKPGCFYKYRPANDDHVESWVGRNEVFLSSPSCLNDPFDCRFVGDLTASEKEKFSWLWCRKALWEDVHDRRTEKPITQRAKRETVRQLLRDPTFMDSQARVEYERGFQQLVANFGVLSLTSINNSVSMFAYYGSEHRGYCLEFRSDAAPFQQSAHEVTYSDAYPSFNLFRDSEDSFPARVLLRKSKQYWEHEREWRVLRSTAGIMPVADNALTGIILGARIDRAFRDRLLGLNRSRKIPARVYIAVPRQYEFGLDIVPV